MNILVVRHDMHGDILVMTSILPGLKKKYPGCEIDFLVNPGYEHVLANNTYIRDVVHADAKDYDLRLVIDHSVRWDRWMPMVHCEQAGVEFAPPQIFLSPSEAAQAPMEGTVALSSAAGWASRRYAHMPGLATVLKLLYPGLNFVQIDNGPDLDPKIEHPKMKVREMIAFLSRCCLLVGVDSLPMHVGAALGVPMVLLMGITGPEIQYVPNATIIRKGPYTSWGDPRKQQPIDIPVDRALRGVKTRLCDFAPTDEFEYTDHLGYLYDATNTFIRGKLPLEPVTRI